MTVVSTWQPNMTTSVLTGLLGYPFLDTTKDVIAEFVFSGFGYTLSAPIIDLFSSTDYQRMTAQVELDEDVLAFCELNGQRNASSEEIRIQEITIRIEVTADHPRTHFVASSVQSLLWLAGPIRLRIPEFRFDVLLNFTAPPEQIAYILQRRQAAYRLMCIEQVCHESLPLPSSLSDIDFDALCFAYCAITERSILRPFYQNTFPFRADEQARALLDANQSFPYHLMLEQLGHELFGHTLHLGPAIFRIENAVFVNPDEVRHELAQLDGHEFQVLIKSLTGTATYQFLDTPYLLINSWDKLVADLVGLENKLVDNLFNVVNELVAGSLADLTEEEKAEVTARTDLYYW